MSITGNLAKAGRAILNILLYPIRLLRAHKRVKAAAAAEIKAINGRIDRLEDYAHILEKRFLDFAGRAPERKLAQPTEGAAKIESSGHPKNDATMQGGAAVAAKGRIPQGSVHEGVFLGWPTQSRAGRDVSPSRQEQDPGLDKENAQRKSSFYNGISFDREGHCLTIAPTGAGKGVGVIIPNLLYYSGSVIVVDPKGENYLVTSRFRRELGQKVLLLDPFREIRGPQADRDRGAMSPFDFMSKDPEQAETEAQMIAEILADSGSSLREPFWDLSAKAVLAALIHSTATSPGIPAFARTFGRVIEQVYDTSLWNDPNENGFSFRAQPRHFGILNQSLSPFARTHIQNIISLNSVTRGSVLSVLQSYLHALSGQSIIESLAYSTISSDSITHDNENGFTIYLVIPPPKLISHAKLLKLWVSLLMNSVMRRQGRVKRRTLFLLDECAQLGALPQLRTAVTLMRGYGLQTWMFFQDLTQLNQLYSIDYQTMINNCQVFQTFGHTRPLPLADILPLASGFNEQDLMAISRRQQIVSMSNRQTFACDRASYLEDKAFAGRFDQNPRYDRATTQRAP